MTAHDEGMWPMSEQAQAQEQDQAWLAERFEGNRPHLRGVAYRMLGSLAEADDAVQEAWLRLSRSDTGEVENLGGWLTTVVARVCLDMLRSRASRREAPLDALPPHQLASRAGDSDPEQEALLADSVGLALLVVLEKLTPAERLAFVLHDMFALSFDEIAPVVERTPAAARQLASRARRRVHGMGEREETAPAPAGEVARRREIVDAFLAAARGGDFAALLAVLDPDVVLHSDRAAVPAGVPLEIRGAAAVAKRATRGGARAAQPALVNGAIGVIVAPRGKLLMVLDFTIADGKIVAIDAIADPERVRGLDLAVLGE